MVGLQHGSHRVVGVVADARRARVATGEELPEPGTEVRSAEDGTEGDPGEHEYERQHDQR
jgi:hypothetical protein